MRLRLIGAFVLLLACTAAAQTASSIGIVVAADNSAAVNSEFTVVPELNSLLEVLRLPHCTPSWTFSDASGPLGSKTDVSTADDLAVVHLSAPVLAATQTKVKARCTAADLVKTAAGGRQLAFAVDAAQGAPVTIELPTDVRNPSITVSGGSYSKAGQNTFAVQPAGGRLEVLIGWTSAAVLPTGVAATGVPTATPQPLGLPLDWTGIGLAFAITLVVGLVVAFALRRKRGAAMAVLLLAGLSLFVTAGVPTSTAPVPAMAPQQIRVGDSLHISEYYVTLMDVRPGAETGLNIPGTNPAYFDVTWRGSTLASNISLIGGQNASVINPLNADSLLIDLRASSAPVGTAARRSAWAEAGLSEVRLAALDSVRLTEQQRKSVADLAMQHAAATTGLSPGTGYSAEAATIGIVANSKIYSQAIVETVSADHGHVMKTYVDLSASVVLYSQTVTPPWAIEPITAVSAAGSVSTGNWWQSDSERLTPILFSGLAGLLCALLIRRWMS